MSALGDLKEAGTAWLDLIVSRPDAAERFNTSREGVLNALIWYFVLVLLTIIVQGLWHGMPSYEQAFLGVLINALPLLGVLLAVVVTVKGLRLALRITTLFVPATYAMTIVLAIGLPLSAFGGGLFANAMLGLLGYMFYRTARDAGKLSIGLSIAFAALSVAVLVALPLGLYMLTVPDTPATS